MSHKTAASSVFPPINENQGQGQPQNHAYTRRRQEFTAIRVDSPTEERKEIPRTPPDEHRRHYSPPDNKQNNRDDSAYRQQQILNQQIQVANKQDEMAHNMAAQNDQMNKELLQRLLNNKDSMIASLRNESDDLSDEYKRSLLTQHIKYIAACVQKMNSDIEGLEAELKGRDIAVIGTNKAVNKLEVHHVTMLQDMRGRIARCDNSIAKHSKDINALMGENQRLELLIHETREKLLTDIHRLESEVMSMTAELERQAGEQRSELSHFRNDTLHRLSTLEDTSKAQMAEVKDTMQSQNAMLDHNMDMMERKFMGIITQATENWNNVMDRVDQRLEKNNKVLVGRLNDLQGHMEADRALLHQIDQSIDARVMTTIQEQMGQQADEVTRLKSEFRDGFRELQESLNNMKRVVEGKRKIMGQHLRREIGQVKKTMLIDLPPNDGTMIKYH